MRTPSYAISVTHHAPCNVQHDGNACLIVKEHVWPSHHNCSTHRDTARPLAGRPPPGSTMTRQHRAKSTRPPSACSQQSTESVHSGLDRHQQGSRQAAEPYPCKPAASRMPLHMNCHIPDPGMELTSTRFRSRGKLGLWSSVNRRASPLRDITARVSPQCAAYSWLPA